MPPEILDAADGMATARWPACSDRAPACLTRDHRRHTSRDRATIGLVTITALIGSGRSRPADLERLIENFHTPLVVATVLSIVLALVADRWAGRRQRLAIPWSPRDVS